MLYLRFIYSLFFYCAFPLILLRLWWRGRYIPAYRQRWHERFGFVPKQNNPTVWLHAVSVGEVVAATPLLQQLMQQYPNYHFIITTMTPTGAAQVQRSFGNSLQHFFIPYDIPFAVQRFLHQIKPQILIIMETELWPNLLHYTAKQQIPIVIANARLSTKSAKGYRWLGRFTRYMLQNITVLIAQSDADVRRFIELGMPANRIKVGGNIKFDIAIPANLFKEAKKLRTELNATARPILIAASTHAGEEALILDAFSKIRIQIPDLLLILVPRHPQRFNAVAELCNEKNYALCRRSQNKIIENMDIYLGDTMGELGLFYAISDVVFVGGSLVPVGGHNLLEPAALSLPIITGKHLFNFSAIANALQQNEALVVVDDVNELVTQVIHLLNNPHEREKLGRHALEVVMHQRGAVLKHTSVIESFLKTN